MHRTGVYLQVLHLTINMWTCKSSPGNSGPPSWAQSRDTQAMQTPENWHKLGGCNTQVQALLPGPRPLLASLRSCLSPTGHSQSLVPPAIVLQAWHNCLTWRAEQGVWDVYQGLQQLQRCSQQCCYPLGSGRLPRTKLCNHTPFFLEHKSFFCNPHPWELCFPCSLIET